MGFNSGFKGLTVSYTKIARAFIYVRTYKVLFVTYRELSGLHFMDFQFIYRFIYSVSYKGYTI